MGQFAMEFTDFIEFSKGTDYELCYEIDTKYSDINIMYDFYVKKQDGSKTHLISTNDFNRGIINYLYYIKGTLDFYEKYCKKLEGKVYGKIC